MATMANSKSAPDYTRRAVLAASPRKAAIEKAKARKAHKAKIRAARKANRETGQSPAKPDAQTLAYEQNTPTPIKKDPQPCNTSSPSIGPNFTAANFTTPPLSAQPTSQT